MQENPGISRHTEHTSSQTFVRMDSINGSLGHSTNLIL
jgi:hypothetical protein